MICITDQPVEKEQSANRLNLSHQHLSSEVITAPQGTSNLSFGAISPCLVKAHSNEVDHS